MRTALNIFVCLAMSGLLAFGIRVAVTADDPRSLQEGLGLAVLGGTLLVAVAAWLIRQRYAERRTISKDVHEHLLFRRSRYFNIAAAVMFALIALSFYLLDQAGSMSERRAWLLPVGMWLCAGVALSGLLLTIKRLTLTLMLSPEGLYYSPFAVGVITWRDVRGIQIKTLGRIELIVLDIATPEKYKSTHPIRRLSWGLDRKVLGSEFAIMADTLGEKTELIADEIRRRIKAFGKGRADSDVLPNPIQATVPEAP
jgi:hypothetical protein